MDLISTITLSVIEGITEFLPISSTGHLILTSQLLNIPTTEFVKSFEISIQLGAILAAAFLYTGRLLKSREELIKVVLVFIPTAILGLLVYKIVKQFLLGSVETVLVSLFLGGVLIILIERYFKTSEGKGEIKDLSTKKALLLGVIQTLSVIPGVSRSATTIFGGMFLGLSRKQSTELSFMVAIPVMATATGYDLLKSYQNFTSNDFIMLGVGILASFITAIFAIKWLVNYVKNHDFTYFGIYRIIISALGWFLIR
jgi:undecaprenyl-diphosphatase